MQNSKYKAICFDWSGVLFFHTIHYRKLGSEFLHVSLDEFSNAYFLHNHLSNLKNLSPRELWTAIFSEFKKESEVDNFIQLLETFPSGELNKDIFPLVYELQKKGYKTGVLSNINAAGAAEIKSNGMEDIFPVVLYSFEIGYMKPDPQAFRILAEKLDVDISEIIFIDDSPKSLEQAGEAGFCPLLYTNIENLTEELKRLGVL